MSWCMCDPFHDPVMKGVTHAPIGYPIVSHKVLQQIKWLLKIPWYPPQTVRQITLWNSTIQLALIFHKVMWRSV